MPAARQRCSRKRSALLDGERALHVRVYVAAEEVAAGRERTHLVRDRLRAGERVLAEELLRRGLVLVDRDVVGSAFLVVEDEAERLVGRRVELRGRELEVLGGDLEGVRIDR